MSDRWIQLELTRPLLLGGLIALPLLVYYSYRSLVDFVGWQKVLSLAARSIIIVLLVLSLSGLTLLKPTHEQFVIFAIDASLSVGAESRKAADGFVERALERAGTNRAAFLPFAAQPAQAMADRAGKPTVFDDKGTDLAAAIEVAEAAIPPFYVPKIVLLSDGNQTTGDALAAALDARVPIWTVPLKTRDEPEVQVSRVLVPAQTQQGEPFNVDVIIDSNHEDEADIEVFRGPHKVVGERKKLAKGENRFRFRQSVTQERVASYTARVRATRDTLLDNNSDSGLVFTSGKPRVLLIESDPKLAKNLAWAMEQEDIQVEVRPPQGMPESLADLQNYELLALSNVPATALTSRQMEVARTYVQDLGGGFIMIGGDQSFGLGGYYKTVIEEILPVRSDFEKEKEKPSLAIMLVLDKSGSMGGQKIELAKDAAKAAVELLGPNDKIGVIVFDGDPYSICEIHSATDKSYILDRIASIEAGGGTNLAPAMQEAFIALHGAFAKLKHVIILSDGISAPGDFEGIAQNMAADRITITTVGVGQDADQNMLEQLAKIGSGRCYITTDPKSVPQIFAKETVTASKSAIHEEPFLAQVIRSTPVLADIDFESAPYLLGYVVTRPKPTCEFILATEQGDPLLAWWRFGLGMAVAFTSDAKSRWAAEWVSWRDYGKFWAQLIRNTMRKSEAKGVVVEMKESKSRGRNDAPDQAKGESPRSIHTVTLDSVDSSGKYLNKAETEMTVIDPQLGTLKVPMIQAAPGRYAAEIDTSRSGAYHIELTQKIGGRVLYRQSRGLMVGYPDELRLRPTNEQLLKSIATVSGGTYDPEPQRVFEPTDRTVSRASPLWPYLVVAAALVLLADVALRRIDLSLVPSALSPLVFRVAKGWLGLSPRSPGRGIEDKVRV